MKKIAISTLYYNNNNYGGMAQAYALQRYIENLGYDVSLISYQRTKPINFYSNKNNINKSKNILILINKIRYKLRVYIEKIMNIFYKDKLENRVNLMKEFRVKEMKHTEICNRNDLSILKEFDVFISGSDQIWRPGVLEDIDVFNTSICDGKCKISYASSVARDELPESYLRFMNNNLKSYYGVSVREKQSAELFKKHVRVDTKWVVDPTLLLTRDEWDKITSKRIIKDNYVFAYVLGDSSKQRRIIEKIAKEKRLCLVTVPHIKEGWLHKFKIVDFSFGDKKMYSVGISEFLSLIKYADLVLTDSFHAVSFSIIFNKEFWALDRDCNVNMPSMNGRIYSLLSLTGLENRYIRSYDQYIKIKHNYIDYEKVEFKKSMMVKSSKEFLDEALKSIK